MSNTFIVLDFETTGISPQHGARTTEVAAVLVVDGQMKERFQRLMNPGVRIPLFIQQLTGITNAMVARAPSNAQVMAELAQFMGDLPWVAHNASFDKKFLDAELRWVGLENRAPVACSLLLARRLYQQLPNHKLETLVRHVKIENDGQFHRALADAEMTARLWLAMQEELCRVHGVEDIPFDLVRKLSARPKHHFAEEMRKAAQKMVISHNGKNPGETLSSLNAP